MKLSSLKNTDIVVIRDGETYMLIDDIFVNNIVWMPLSSYDEDMKCLSRENSRKDYDIIKVYTKGSSKCFGNQFYLDAFSEFRVAGTGTGTGTGNYKLVWDREYELPTPTRDMLKQGDIIIANGEAYIYIGSYFRNNDGYLKLNSSYSYNLLKVGRNVYGAYDVREIWRLDEYGGAIGNVKLGKDYKLGNYKLIAERK